MDKQEPPIYENYGQPELNESKVYKVGDENDFYFQPTSVNKDVYSKIKAVIPVENQKFKLIVSYGEDETSLTDETYIVLNGDILSMNVTVLDGSWVYGHAVLSCKVKVEELSENKVILTMIEIGEENLDK